MAYKITIRSLGDSGYVNAYLPEEFTLNLEHRWENPFEVDMKKETMAGLQWIGKQFGFSAGGWDPSKIGNALGIDTFTYMGSSPLSISWELEFVINRSIEEELRDPIRTLVKMSCPKTGSESVLSMLGRPDPVQISIPGVLEIDKAFILNVGVNMMKPLVTDGIRTVPLRARVPLTIISAYIVTTDRSDKMLFP